MPSIVCETWFISFGFHKLAELSSTALAERVRKLQRCVQGRTAGEEHSREESETSHAWSAPNPICRRNYSTVPLLHLQG